MSTAVCMVLNLCCREGQEALANRTKDLKRFVRGHITISHHAKAASFLLVMVVRNLLLRVSHSFLQQVKDCVKLVCSLCCDTLYAA